MLWTKHQHSVKYFFTFFMDSLATPIVHIEVHGTSDWHHTGLATKPSQRYPRWLSEGGKMEIRLALLKRNCGNGIPAYWCAVVHACRGSYYEKAALHWITFWWHPYCVLGLLLTTHRSAQLSVSVLILVSSHTFLKKNIHLLWWYNVEAKNVNDNFSALSI